MFTELGATGSTLLYVNLSSNGPLSALWQMLAVLALIGIVLVVVLAIIEPGPLVKRRPFPRAARTRQSEPEGPRRTSADQPSVPAGADENLDSNDGE